MAVEKLSQFTNASSPPALTDWVPGANAGSPNLRYQWAQILQTINRLFDNGTATGGGTSTINVANGQKQKLTATGAATFTVAYTNWAAAGIYNEVELQLVNGGGSTITWPTVNWMVGDGTSSTTFASMGVALQSAGTNWVVVWTTDGGATLYGRAS